MKKTNILIGFVVLLLFTNTRAQKQEPLSSAQIDSLVQYSMKAMPDQVGIAIAVVKDGEVIHSKGYGYLSIEKEKQLDKHSLFAIASNTKAFTTMALSILVDEGKLDWEDKVSKYIPEFRMYDSYVTENFNILDLLTHRSGLGLGAGDLMHFPDGGDYTIQDVLTCFQYMEPVSAFRTKYDYDNLLYTVAGEVIARISGMSWIEFVEQRIMRPIGMKNSAGSLASIKNTENIAQPHSEVNKKLIISEPHYHVVTNPGGGIYASADEMAKWLLLNLNRGKYGKDLKDTLVSEKCIKQMWKPHTNMEFQVIPDKRYKNHYKAYGLGWEIADYGGYVTLGHGGGLPGMLSQTLLIPELNFGAIILTNSRPGGLSYFTMLWSIVDSYLGIEKRDWIKIAKPFLESNRNQNDSITTAVWETVKKNKNHQPKPEDYTGMYEDPWFGKVEISLKNNKLYFRALRSPKLKGEMFFYKATTFAVKWEYTDLPCDAFASFQLDHEGKATKITMKGISPNVDFSFDFHDLDLRRID